MVQQQKVLSNTCSFTLTGISQLEAVQEMKEDMAQDRDRFMKQNY